MASHLKVLQQLDAKVWTKRARRLIGCDRLPVASQSRIAWATGIVLYRSVYYMSNNRVYPYVRLRRYESFPLPLVQCCTEEEFISFLSETFHDVELTVPIEIKEQVCDL